MIIAPLLLLLAQVPGQPVPIGDVPIRYYGEYHLATGTWTLGGPTGRSRARVLYNCTFPTGYYFPQGSSWTGGGFVADEGVIPDANALELEQISGFDFAYCTPTLASTRNGVSFKLSFYDDYVPCTLPPAPNCEYLLTDLPVSSTGNLSCWSVAVDLTGGLECTSSISAPFHSSGAAGRSFGYRIEGMYTFNGPPIAQMGPVLARPCPTPVAGCSTAGGWSNGGNLNQLLWGTTSNLANGCWWFGGVPYAALDLVLYGPEAGSYPFQGSYPNRSTLESTAWIPGNPITWTGRAAVTNSDRAFLLLSRSHADRPHPAGRILVGRALLAAPEMTVLPSGEAVFTAPIPPSARGPIFAQAAFTDASGRQVLAWSNGLAHL
ncbi:MAG: hypothetical protein D6702_12575 [Planctomycetota bacterium]|nr:MAG: hypothetical protein D6702_12575 [Planctomycetota bacterium]